MILTYYLAVNKNNVLVLLGKVLNKPDIYKKKEKWKVYLD